MKNIKMLVKEIQENENFAKKYKGLNNVKAIMEQAKKDGYEIKENDLNEENLKKIAGGGFINVGVEILNQKVETNVVASGENSRAVNKSTITMTGKGF